MKYENENKLAAIVNHPTLIARAPPANNEKPKKAFEKTTGKTVKYKIAPRRSGDIAECYADPTKAKNELGWVAEKTLEDMCKDSWNYIEGKKNND